MQCLDQPHLGLRQQFREHREIATARGTDLERSVHIDTDDVPSWSQPELSLARQQDAPGLVLLPADQGVLAVGAEPAIGAGLASGAGQVVVAAGSAVFGPSTRLEMPAAESPDNDMDASR